MVSRTLHPQPLSPVWFTSGELTCTLKLSKSSLIALSFQKTNHRADRFRFARNCIRFIAVRAALGTVLNSPVLEYRSAGCRLSYAAKAALRSKLLMQYSLRNLGVLFQIGKTISLVRIALQPIVE